jgi:putative transposase
MPRKCRPDIPGYPQHIVQRGNNRMPCFLDDVDRRRYLVLLHEALIRYDCSLHAYVLMDNHAHLLMTPQAERAVSRLMQTLGRNYVGWFNRRHQRSGTLWEGRFHGSLVDNDHHLLACHRYIELNPVRAGMCADPVEFAWSSHHGNLRIVDDPMLTPHARLVALHPDPVERARRYRMLFATPLEDSMVAAIRSHARQRGTLGTETFRRRTEASLCRFTGVRPAHRPRTVRRGGDPEP